MAPPPATGPGGPPPAAPEEGDGKGAGGALPPISAEEYELLPPKEKEKYNPPGEDGKAYPKEEGDSGHEH